MLLRTMWQTNCRYEFVRITEVTADRLLRAACESCDAGASLTQMLLPIYGCFLMPVTQCWGAESSPSVRKQTVTIMWIGVVCGLRLLTGWVRLDCVENESEIFVFIELDWIMCLKWQIFEKCMSCILYICNLVSTGKFDLWNVEAVEHSRWGGGADACKSNVTVLLGILCVSIVIMCIIMMMMIWCAAYLLTADQLSFGWVMGPRVHLAVGWAGRVD